MYFRKCFKTLVCCLGLVIGALEQGAGDGGQEECGVESHDSVWWDGDHSLMSWWGSYCEPHLYKCWASAIVFCIYTQSCTYPKLYMRDVHGNSEQNFAFAKTRTK